MVRIVKGNTNQKNEEVLYAEWVPVGRFVKSMVLFVCLLIVSLGLIFSAFEPEVLLFVGIMFGLVSLFIFLMYLNFRGLKITLTNNQLEVAYGILNRKKIPIKAITNCDVTKAQFRTYGGAGIRLGLDGSSAYNTDFREAVKLTFQKGRPFLFSTRNPQEICNLINKLAEKDL